MNKYYGESAPIQTVIKADREEWIELLGSTVKLDTLRHLGLSKRTWSAISAGKSPPVPVAAYRMAQFHRYGHLADVLGGTWADFFVSGDTLTLPGVKQPLQAQDLRTVWLELQELPALRHKVKRLMAESDYVEVSAAVTDWLFRMGSRPLVLV